MYKNAFQYDSYRRLLGGGGVSAQLVSAREVGVVCLGGVCLGGCLSMGVSVLGLGAGGVCMGVSPWECLFRGCLPGGIGGCLPRGVSV